MRITIDEARHVAELARLTFSDAEFADLTRHFEKILSHVEKLRELPTDGVEPTAHAVDVTAPLRDDVVGNPADQQNTDALLANAPDRKVGFFRVPKIIE